MQEKCFLFSGGFNSKRLQSRSVALLPVHVWLLGTTVGRVVMALLALPPPGRDATQHFQPVQSRKIVIL